MTQAHAKDLLAAIKLANDLPTDRRCDMEREAYCFPCESSLCDTDITRALASRHYRDMATVLIDKTLKALPNTRSES